jgi:hypothetical protein
LICKTYQVEDHADAALRISLTKLGNTMFEADGIVLHLSQPWFVPAAAINALWRGAVAAHEGARLAARKRPQRKVPVEPRAAYPATQLSYLANVYNDNARAFSEARRLPDRRGLRSAPEAG